MMPMPGSSTSMTNPCCSQKARTWGHTASGDASTTSQRSSPLRSTRILLKSSRRPDVWLACGRSVPYSDKVALPEAGTAIESWML